MSGDHPPRPRPHPPRRAVTAAGQYELAVRAEGDGVDNRVVTENGDQLPRVSPPQPRRAVKGAVQFGSASQYGGDGQYELAVRAEGDGENYGVVMKSGDQQARIMATESR